jgi:hypothetical protein
MRAIKTYESFFKKKNILKPIEPSLVKNQSFLKNLSIKKKQEWIKNKAIVDEVKESFLDLIDSGFEVDVDFSVDTVWARTFGKKTSPIHLKFICVKINLHQQEFAIDYIKDTLEASLAYLKESFNLVVDEIRTINKYGKLEIVNNLNKMDYDKEFEYLKIFLI